MSLFLAEDVVGNMKLVEYQQPRHKVLHHRPFLWSAPAVERSNKLARPWLSKPMAVLAPIDSVVAVTHIFKYLSLRRLQIWRSMQPLSSTLAGPTDQRKYHGTITTIL